MPTHRFYFWYTALITVAILGSMAWRFYQANLDGTVFNKVIEYASLDWRTEKQVYHPGEMVRSQITFTKYRDIPAIFACSLVDTYSKQYPPQNRSIAALGRFENVSIELELVPRDTWPGIYHFQCSIIYSVNNLRDVHFLVTTNTFEVKR